MLRARILAAVAVVTVVAACASPEGVAPIPTDPAVPLDTATTDPARAFSAYGGTLVVGVAGMGSLRSLNPLLEGPDSELLGLLTPALFAQGFDRDPATGSPVPNVIEAIPSISDGTVLDHGDGTFTVTYSVVDGARWSDRSMISGSDLAFTIELATDRSLPIRPEVRAAYAGVLPGTVSVRGRSVTLRMRGGHDLASLFEVIVPRASVEGSDFARRWDTEMWPTGGPFVLGAFQPGSYLELNRNPEYWKVTAAEGAPLPFLDRIVVRFFDDETGGSAALADDFERGAVDVAVVERTSAGASALAPYAASGAAVTVRPAGPLEALVFQVGPTNRNPGSLNRFRDFREAVVASLDREALAENYGAVPTRSVVDAFLGSDGGDAFAAMRSDPIRLGELFEPEDGESMAGARILLTVPSDIPTMVDTAERIVVMLGNAGFRAQLQLEGPGDYLGSTLPLGSWDVTLVRIDTATGVAGVASFFELFRGVGVRSAGGDPFGWGTLSPPPEVLSDLGAILQRLERAADPRDLGDLLYEAEATLAAASLLVPLSQVGSVVVASWPGVVVGVTDNPRQGPLWNVATWRRSAG